MHLKQIGIVLSVTVLILFAVLIAKVFKLIEIRHPKHDSDSGLKNILPRVPRQTQEPFTMLRDTPERLFWFIQLTDIHISMFHDPDRIRDLEDFCKVTVNVIKPEVLLASGDLSDGKASDNMGSNQYIQEWETYSRVLAETKVTEKTIWLDIRGNHDNFNVPGVLSERSYYHRFSVQGKKHVKSYMFVVEKGNDKYSFIGVDAALEPGPRRPFNFIGNIDEEQYSLLSSFERESQNSTGRIWFGHYPTSCIISTTPGIRQLMRNSTAYLCGHLHTLGGMVPNMYTVQQSGLLEIELGDWKDNRMYRVAAFDHGLFSFTDVHHRDWPVILVTNPKHALFVFPNKEPLELIRESSHIRILVFSPDSIIIVRVKVDDNEWVDCRQVDGPLFVAQWDPAIHSAGLHNLLVYAELSTGVSKEIVHPFSLDGTTLSFRLLSRIVLMTHAEHVFNGFFYTFVIASVVPFLLLRILHYFTKAKRIMKPSFGNTFLAKIVRRLWILSTVNRIFVPVVLFPLYLTVGPWFIGEVIEGHIGASFAWGTVVSWTVLPTSFTYVYGTIQLFFLHLPFVIMISYCIDARFKSVCLMNNSPASVSTPITKRHVICTIHLIVQMTFAYYFWLAYGTLAFILGFMRTWSVFLSLYLWYTSTKLSAADFVEAKLIYGKYEADQSLIQNGGDALLHSM